MTWETILYLYLMTNFLMTLEAWWLDYRLLKELKLPQPHVTHTAGAFVVCTLLMMPLRMYMMNKKKRRARR